MLAASMLSGCVLNVVGSDTTSNYMGAVTTGFNADAVANPNAHTVRNTPPTLPNPGSFHIPGDTNPSFPGFGCAAFDYTNPGNLPPNGSGAGISALAADVNTCVDIARSSSGRGSEPANFEFWAYATDGVSWAHYGGSAPANLTVSQLRGIYLCDQPGGVPLFTNWSQVGGANVPIKRFLPQTGSGTLKFFETKVLGLSTAQLGVLDDSACVGNPLQPRVQENTGTAVPAGDKPDAILPYSYGVWTAQSTGAEPDNRGGAVLGQINGVAPSASTIAVGGTFFSKRYVYNVVKNNTYTYPVNLEFMGVKPSGANQVGYICQNNFNNALTKALFGFVPLANGATGPGLPNSTCRLNPTPL